MARRKAVYSRGDAECVKEAVDAAFALRPESDEAQRKVQHLREYAKRWSQAVFGPHSPWALKAGRKASRVVWDKEKARELKIEGGER